MPFLQGVVRQLPQEFPGVVRQLPQELPRAAEEQPKSKAPLEDPMHCHGRLKEEKRRLQKELDKYKAKVWQGSLLPPLQGPRPFSWQTQMGICSCRRVLCKPGW